MSPRQLEDEVKDRLVDELGEHGQCALELFDTAYALMSTNLPDASRLGQAVAHCLRQALKAIGEAGAGGESVAWRDLSRAVVDAYEQYRRVEGLGVADDVEEQALSSLLSRVDALKQFHDDEPGRHQRRLRSVMDRVGATPITADSITVDPLKAAQDLFSRLNTAAHDDAGPIDPEQLWEESLDVLRRLFLPPQVRIPELERLAEIKDPTEHDRDAVMKLVASPEHLRRFLDRVTSPTWLTVLSDSGHLDPPSDESSGWPAHQAVRRLSESHPSEVSDWLKAMARQHKSDPIYARCIAHAASAAGEPGASVVLEILHAHQHDRHIVFSALRAAEQLPAADQRVEAFADVILDKWSWSRTTWIIPLLRHIKDGITQQNARQRIELLCYKIPSDTDEDHSLWWLGADLSGSVSDIDGERTGNRFEALLCYLLAAVEVSWTYLAVSDLLEFTQMLPNRIAPRVRAWILAQAPDATPELLLAEIVHAMSSRQPSGDDLAMLDRAVNEVEAAVYGLRWGTTLGDAPTVTELVEALKERLPEDLMRKLLWASLLPEEARGDWVDAVQIFSARYGSPRQGLQRRHGVEVSSVESPIDEAELRSMEPEVAARRVAGWMPAPGESHIQQHLVAQTLQSVVEQDPDKWLTSPLSIASILHRPRYIGAYLEAATTLVPKHDLPIRSLLRVIELIRSRPWEITPISEEWRDVTDDWGYAETTAIRLIQTMASSNNTFVGCAEEVWALLETAITNCPPRPEPTSNDQMGAHFWAINRTCTQALDAAIWLLRNQYLDSGEVSPTALRVLDASLRLKGDDGAEHRSMIAPWVAFLRHALCDWTEANHTLMFGPEAPEGLAQSMVDDAIQWGQPNDWLLENHREMVHNSVERDIENALDHLLIAMLRRLPGYSVQEVIGLVGKTPEALSTTGDRLGRLLSRSDLERDQVEIAVSFWQAALDTAPQLGDAAGDALHGFGWFSEAHQIDSDMWAQLTLRTIRIAKGHLDWQHGIAERIINSNPSPTGLAILNELVRGPNSQWELHDLAKQAAQALDSAQELQDTIEYRRLDATLIERGLSN